MQSSICFSCCPQRPFRVIQTLPISKTFTTNANEARSIWYLTSASCWQILMQIPINTDYSWFSADIQKICPFSWFIIIAIGLSGQTASRILRDSMSNWGTRTRGKLQNSSCGKCGCGTFTEHITQAAECATKIILHLHLCGHVPLCESYFHLYDHTNLKWKQMCRFSFRHHSPRGSWLWGEMNHFIATLYLRFEELNPHCIQ